MRNIEAEIDRTLRPFDSETECRALQLRLASDIDGLREWVDFREDQRAGLAARIRRDIEKGAIGDGHP